MLPDFLSPVIYSQFLWNWFNQLSPGFTAIGADTVTLVWILVDAVLPLLSVAMGMFLLRGDGNG